MNMQTKWAIIGLGFIAPRHIEAIKHIGGEVIVTCDNDPLKNADYLDYEVMMGNEIWKEVTHVAICTPNYLHFPMCRSMRDKIVLCEKPLVLHPGHCLMLPDNIFTVFQLRHHPEVMRLKEAHLRPQVVKMRVKVKRDEHYWKSWKGDSTKSGGILYNLGVHYFDLLIHLFGNEYEVLTSTISKTSATGVITFNGVNCIFDLAILPDSEGQDRSLEIDGQEISLSKQDNLSFEDLHKKVYESLLKGDGVKPKEAHLSISLIDAIQQTYGRK